MTQAIRAPSPEEADAYFFISQYSFDGERSEEGRAKDQQDWALARCLASFEGNEPVAGLRIWPLTMRINGGRIGLGGVADVCCLPEHRRKGHVGQLLEASLEKQRADGQPISGLGTPFPEVYRKYGWEYANLGLLYKFSPRVTLRRQPARGSARRIGTDQWETLNRLYHQYIEHRNGYIERTEQWAREHLLRRWNQECDIALWEEDGQPTGYVVYAIRQQTGDVPWPKSFVWIRDFVALTPDAFSGLFAYLLSHDRTISFFFRAPIDFPFSSAFVDPGVIRTDPDRVTPEADELLMLRVVDFKAAIQARPALAIANGAAFTVRIHDKHAPWNDGTWRVEAAEGKCAVEQTSSAPELECDIRDFAPIYASHSTPRALAETGAIVVHNEAALDAAGRIFSANYAPWTADGW